MSKTNGNMARLEAVEADHRSLRQLFMDEMRAVNKRLKTIEEICRDNGKAFDTVLQELKLKDKEDAEG